MKYAYELKMKVRDYECDLEGIVNNANYQHYMEHTRHEFLLEAGLSFADMCAHGIVPVVARVTIAYKTPLRSGDVMLSRLWVESQGVRFVFHQDIFNRDTGRQAVHAVVSIVCLRDGKLTRGDELRQAFAQYLAKP